MIPVIVVVKNNVVYDAYECEDGIDLEKKFRKKCMSFGIEPITENIEDGYAEKNGVSVCMTWVKRKKEN